VITTVVLTGVWSEMDGSPSYGALTLQLLNQLLDSTTGATIDAGTQQVPLDQNGNLVFQVPANDDSTTQPAGTSYFARLTLIGAPESTGYLIVPHQPAGSRTVSDLVGTVGLATIVSATAAFTGADVGKWVSGPGIPYYTQIQSVQSGTHATLNQPLTQTVAASTLVIGASANLAELMAA
jgi:hypothetical protein